MYKLGLNILNSAADKVWLASRPGRFIIILILAFSSVSILCHMYGFVCFCINL
jgi:hypothetical protein